MITDAAIRSIRSCCCRIPCSMSLTASNAFATLTTMTTVGRRVAFPVHRAAEPIDRELTALHLLAGDPLIPETGSATDAYHYVVKDLLARAPSPDEGTLLARGAAVDHKGLSLSGSAL